MKDPGKMDVTELRMEVRDLRKQRLVQLELEVSNRKLTQIRIDQGLRLGNMRRQLQNKTDEYEHLCSLLSDDEKNLQFRLDRVTDLACTYATAMIDNKQTILELTKLSQKYAQKLFEAAGHITAVKEPTPWGMGFATDIYRIISEKYFPTANYNDETFRKLRETEQQIGMKEVLESRAGLEERFKTMRTKNE